MHAPIFSLVVRPITSNLHPLHRISNFLNRGQWLRARLFRKGKVQHSYQKSIIQTWQAGKPAVYLVRGEDCALVYDVHYNIRW